MSEVRHFFRTNEVPIYFVGATAFNLLGLDRWVRNFSYIAYYDSWDGAHPRLFTPKNKPYIAFESSEHINNYLLRDPEVRAYLERRGGTPMVAMVFFDEETEEICKELGYTLILPPDSLRRRLDSKIVTTQLGDDAGVPSVPNVIAEASSYSELDALAAAAKLGSDLVVQTPYGDSGKTTFFIKSEADWDENAGHMVGQELKIMKLDVLGLVRAGMSNKLIARRLEISEKTVKAHLTRVYERLGVSDRHLRRTATQDFELRGQTIRAGENVTQPLEPTPTA